MRIFQTEARQQINAVLEELQLTVSWEEIARPVLEGLYASGDLDLVGTFQHEGRGHEIWVYPDEIVLAGSAIFEAEDFPEASEDLICEFCQFLRMVLKNG